MSIFIGRAQEIRLIQDRLSKEDQAQLIVLYGRRRVGKSSLIRHSLKDEKNVLFFEGIQGERSLTQIKRFTQDLANQTGRVPAAAKNWDDAFRALGEVILDGKKIIVIDEFPWLAAGRTRIVSELKIFWDQWAAKNPKLVLILCGSVASFMVKHLIHSKALHNRKTLEICLPPLRPEEISGFFPTRSVFEKAQYYMCFGGIPKYIEQINPNRSFEQNINHLCFTSHGFFIEEFSTLFKEQFKSIRIYEKLVSALAQRAMNLSDLSEKIKFSRGGGLHSLIENLIAANFVREYQPVRFGKPKSKTKKYKLVDPFLIFYFWYIHPNKKIIERNQSENLFSSITGKNIQQYYGLAFERLCEDSFERILERLDLHLADIENFGPYFRQSSPKNKGFQIDNFVIRRDGTWMVMEYKYSKQPIGPEIIDEIEEKIRLLDPPDSVSIEKVLISATGASQALMDKKYFQQVLTLKDLV